MNNQTAWSQAAKQMQLLGTRSWIKVSWNQVKDGDAFQIYYSDKNEKPLHPYKTITEKTNSNYIDKVQPNKLYYVWVDIMKNGKSIQQLKQSVYTTKKWTLDVNELKELQSNPSSVSVPEGMVLHWQDEFNDSLLNLNKWSTNYFSSLNYVNDLSKKEMLENKLPQPAYVLNGKTINLYVSDSLPTRLYVPTGSQKISSIQTYDWRTNENLLDNSRGGYFEVRVKRSKTGNPKGTNTAFWFDAPGPDLKYYLEQGSEAYGSKGIRPKGQVFEIDVFELLNAQFVLHGHVDKNGKFIRNLNTHIAEGFQHENEWVTHGMLWTPTSIEHYINGKLIKAYTDKHQIYSPNHFMNVFLGTYGSQGGVNMEVDYIRYYTWPLKGNNELPNGNFDALKSIAPWEGNGTVQAGIGRNQSPAVILKPGQSIIQYVYLNNAQHYNLQFWSKGNTSCQASIMNVKEVTGETHQNTLNELKGAHRFKASSIDFTTEKDHPLNMKTIKIMFSNTGNDDLILDDITIKKKINRI
ncbi:MAG: glycosyl hydrolase family protein [Chitinophagaceae bacterium]|nr:MAG: glycosyl hydrolase family protein [Chitinophagaceae bacterium]